MFGPFKMAKHPKSGKEDKATKPAEEPPANQTNEEDKNRFFSVSFKPKPSEEHPLSNRHFSVLSERRLHAGEGNFAV